jgi:uncharacterized protein
MVKCVFHNDLDGHCAGGIVKLKHPEAEMIEMVYGWRFPWERIKQEDTVYMVDFSLEPFEDMLRLSNSCKLIWIDHHISALEEAKTHPEFSTVPGLRQNGVAACVLTWTYCFPDKQMPRTVKLLGSYDVWDFADPWTLPFQYGMRSKETDPAKDMSWWKTLLKESMWVEEIIKDGQVIVDYEEQSSKKYVKAYSFETEIDGLRAIACNRGIASSKMFDSVWDESKYDIMISFCRLKTKRWTISLYSTKPEVDCSAIAKKYGGGGHHSSAGCTVQELPFQY